LKIDTNHKFLIVLFTIVLAGCLSGCHPLPEVSPIKKDGKTYGVTSGAFRHRWWNYYDRGLSFADGEFWKDAEADFRQALTQENAPENDERQIRTYGRHFTDYFPHRELGIVLFHQGRHSEAIKELETSFSTVKSAKAAYYLNRVRKIWIEQENLDARPPEIIIETPAHEMISNRFTVTVSGSATDDTYVNEIRVNGIPVRIDLAEPQISFKKDVPLKMGPNRIVVEVRDITGKTGKSERKIVCDRTGPVLNIDEIVRISHSDNRYLIRGYAHDRSGIRRIRVNGQEIVKGMVPEIVLEHPFPLPSGRKTAVVTAEDIAGNQTRAELELERELLHSGLSSSPSSHSRFLASLDLLKMIAIRTPDDRINEGMSKLGDYHALIIGINDYDEWRPLKNAVNDANALRDSLIRRYGFLPENILFRTDKEATRDRLMSDLACLAEGLREPDNLLIYFAGHGQLDTTTNVGYWIPVDGVLDDHDSNHDTWIPNFAIQRFSEKISAKNVIIIADACFSGSLLRSNAGTYAPGRVPKPESGNHKGTPAAHTGGLRMRGRTSGAFSKGDKEKLLERASKPSRQIMSSGGITEIPDQGKAGHSPFAHYFLKKLEANKEPFIDMEALFYGVGESLAKEGVQRPKFGRLKTDMDNGQFVLKLVQASKSEHRREPVTLAQYCKRFSDIQPSFLDDIPPVIEIKGWAEKKEHITYGNETFFGLRIRDESGIRKIRINGQELVMRSEGTNIYLNHLSELKVGDNPFLIECIDQFGNQARQRILIRRKLTKVYESGSRMSVLLLPFTVEGAGPQIEGVSLEDFITRSLLKHPGYDKRFNKKEPLTETYPKDHDDALRLARKIGAEFVLKGEITSKERDSLDILVKMVEVETSQVVTSDVDVYGEVVDEKLVRELCHGLVIKLCDSLPLVEGKVIRIKAKKVIIDLGENRQVKKGMHLIFFQEEEPILNPDNGEMLEPDVTELGTGRIQRILPKISYTEVMDMDASELKARHQVITK